MVGQPGRDAVAQQVGQFGGEHELKPAAAKSCANLTRRGSSIPSAWTPGGQNEGAVDEPDGAIEVARVAARSATGLRGCGSVNGAASSAASRRACAPRPAARATIEAPADGVDDPGPRRRRCRRQGAARMSGRAQRGERNELGGGDGSCGREDSMDADARMIIAIDGPSGRGRAPWRVPWPASSGTGTWTPGPCTARSGGWGSRGRPAR